MIAAPSWTVDLLEDGARRAAVRLEKRASEQFKPDLSCIAHIFFRRREDGAMAPFMCGSWTCPTCAAARARTVRAGVYRAVRAFALVDMLTLTLSEGARGSTPLEARVALLSMFNAMRTRLRKRGFLGSYLWVTEAHEDGTPHLHVAVNLRALLAAAGNQEWAEGVIADAWTELGGGPIVKVTWGRGDGRTAAGYLSKYLGKSQGVRAPWDGLRYCTEDGSFRTRPWHRYGCSRDVGRAMKEPDRPTVGTWALVRAADSGTPWEPFIPAKGSAIVPGCAEAGGHPIAPWWVPGSCHHGGTTASLGCFCTPPWAWEPGPEDFSPRGRRIEAAARALGSLSEEALDAASAADLKRFEGPTPDEYEAHERGGRGRSWGWGG